MKIAFLSDSVYPFRKGGKETRSYELASELAKRNHEVHFYTMKFWKGKDIIKKNNITFHGICKEYPLYNGKNRSIKQAILFGFAAFKLLKPSEDFDVLDADHMVYFHLWPAKLACILKRKNLVVTWHEVWGKEYWKQYMGRKGILGYIMEKLSSKLPNKIISISNQTSNRLKKEFKIPSRKISTIPCAIHLQKLNKIKPSREKSDIIFAGRLISHKNINILIKSIKIIKQSNKKYNSIKCIIIGDGPEKENLINLTKELNLEKNIIFKGIIEKTEDVYSMIKSSKVFVLPSTREGFGIVVIEANALGIPVIAINHKDNASRFLIKEGKNGFVSELNEKDLANVISKAIKSSKAMQVSSIAAASQYDWSNIIEQFEGVYRG